MIENNEFYLTLVRHGQSTRNATPNIMGATAMTPLSELGIKQSELLGARLVKEKVGIDLVYSSNYTRALDTAKVSLKRVPNTGIKIAEDLKEYNAGDWLDLNRDITLTPEIKSKMNFLNHAFLPPNGESLHQVERRASKWLEDNILYNKEIIDKSIYLNSKGDAPLNIFCFSHGMTIKCLLHYIVGFDKSFTWKIAIDNTSLTKFYFGKNGWQLLNINDCAHLL